MDRASPDDGRMRNTATLEIPVDGEDTARLAAAFADRIEVCRDLEAEGLTPCPSFVAGIVRATRLEGRHPDIAVLFQELSPPADRRSVTPEDFPGRPQDLERLEMLAPGFAAAGADSIVLGFLDDSGYPDVAAVSTAVAIAGRHGMKIAFHRAFDLAEDPGLAVTRLIELGVVRTLAAGSPGYDASSATMEDRVARIGIAADAIGDRDFAIVPCGGIRSTNAARFAAVTPHVHASCRRRPSAFEPGEFDEDEAAALRGCVHPG